DIDRIEQALAIFRETQHRPTFIILDSHIGYGAPHKHDTSAAHGEPLGEEEIRLAKRFYGWPEDAKFLVPDAVREHFAAGIARRGGGRSGARSGRARGGAAPQRVGLVWSLGGKIPGAPAGDRARAAGGARGGWGEGATCFSRRSKRHRRSRCLG